MPRPAPRRETPRPSREAIAERRLRSLEESLDVRWAAAAPYPRLEVRNPAHRTHYLVLVPLYPAEEPAFCTCTDFARRGLGTCKHIEAALRWLRMPERPDPPVVPTGPAQPRRDLWAEIDQRSRELGRGPRDDVRALARPGALLFEPPPEGAAGRPGRDRDA
jgi:hypothetical protein